MTRKMNKSDLIQKLSNSLTEFKKTDIDEATDLLIDSITDSLTRNKRIEIRGFGSFSTRERKTRLARNPKTGSAITVNNKFHPYLRASKHLNQLLNN